MVTMMMFLMIMIMIIVIVVNAQLNCKGNDYRQPNLFLRLSFVFLLCSARPSVGVSQIHSEWRGTAIFPGFFVTRYQI